MRVKTLLVLVAVVLLSAAPMAFGQNLVTNGSFEDGGGSFNGWNETGNFEFSGVTTGAFYVYTGAEDGQFYGYFGPVSSPGGISQTISDTAGQQYVFSFYLAAVGDDPSSASVMWNGTTLYSASDPNTGGNWQLFSFDVIGTGHDTISFNFQDDPAYIALDNVSVVASGGGSVPEPSSFLLMGSGVLGLAGLLRRKLIG